MEKLVALALFLLTTLPLVACSSKSETTNSATVPGTSTPVATPSAAGPPWPAFIKGDVITYVGTVGANTQIEIRLKKEGTSGNIINLQGTGVKQGGTEFPIKGYVSIDDRILTIDDFHDSRRGSFGGGKFVSDTKIEGELNNEKFSWIEKERTQNAQLSARIDRIAKGLPVTAEPDEVITPQNPNEEAASEIRHMFEQIYIKCGDSYYRKADSQNPNFVEFWQWKDVAFQPAPREITETDRLNKIEWAGQVYVVSKFRRYCIGRKWENYRDGGIMKLNAYKTKGQWQLDTDFLSANRGWGRPTCVEIPKD